MSPSLGHREREDQEERKGYDWLNPATGEQGGGGRVLPHLVLNARGYAARVTQGLFHVIYPGRTPYSTLSSVSVVHTLHIGLRK